MRAVLLGGLVGGVVGWLILWRIYGQPAPFAVLVAVIIGMLIIVARDLGPKLH